VKNNDSTGCSTVNYSLSAQAPSGWSSSLSATTLSLAPGASGTANVTVTSPSSATSGVYSTVVKATNSAATTYSGSANANYGINAVAGLAISASPTALSIAQGGSGSSTVSVSGGASSTSLSVSGLPSGLTASFSTTSIAGGSGSSLLTFRPASTLSAGTYTVTVNAYDGTKTVSTNIAVTVTAVTTSSDFSLTVSPTSITMPQGTSGSATVRTALVGSFNSSVTLSVSGMPSGVSASMNPATIAAPGAGSSTLSVSASSAAPAGTYNLTVTANGGGKAHTANFTLVITSSGGGTGTASQLIVNPGFESGQTGWAATTGVITYLSGEYAHTGSWKAWLSGYGNPTTRSMYQQVSIPSNTLSATLSFWLHVDSYDTTGIAHDRLNVQVLDSYGRLLGTLASYSNVNKASGYQLRTFDLSAYRGRAIRLYFVATEDSSLRTNFVVDDVTLNVK
ncbi:MAG TPA: NEW3 domain-containing protein, partial [Terriglobales bacterium]|nr:NEW3 domain-containing protein [Terriglobales bacterium]